MANSSEPHRWPLAPGGRWPAAPGGRMPVPPGAGRLQNRTQQSEAVQSGNVSAYMDWRGDIPFSVDPFNEVDNLLLSLFSYADLEGVAYEGEEITLDDACRRYFSIHTREEIMARTSYVKMVPFLMEKASGLRRYAGIRLHHYVNVINADATEQMSAVTFDLEDGTSYVAYRGTDGSIVGWREDFNLAWLRQSSGQKHAVEYLNQAGEVSGRDLRVGGHSKGGNFAVYAAAFCDESVRDRILEVYTNDGPGFIREVAQSDQMSSIQPKIRSIVPDESLFGLLMYGQYGHEVITSSARGVLQHDAQTWQILGNHFVRAEGLRGSSVLLNRILTDWIEDVEIDKRRQFVDFLFDVLETPGVDTFAKLRENKARNLAELVKTARGMDKERRDEFFEVLSVLVKNSRNTLSEELKKGMGENRKPLDGS